jgi:hypothetical protein
MRKSKASKIWMLGWWMVTNMVRLLSATFLMVFMTMAAARASRPEVGGRQTWKPEPSTPCK